MSDDEVVLIFVTPEWLYEMQELVEDVEIDLDAPLSDDDE